MMVEFQIKNQKFESTQIVAQIVENMHALPDDQVVAQIEQLYADKYATSAAQFLKFAGSDIKSAEYWTLARREIMGKFLINFFEGLIGASVRIERVTLGSATRPSEITPEIVEKNLTEIRKVRKQTVHHQYTQKYGRKLL